MLKKSFAVLTLVVLTACGPAPQPPADPAAPPAPAVAAPAPVAVPVPAPAPAPVAQAAPAPRPAPPHHRAPRPRAEPAPEPVHQVCNDCGVITAVQEQRVKGDATAIGTLGGAAAGGLAGSQFGKKSGKILATIGGAVLGGLAGREVEKQVRATHVYDVTVNMEAGGSRTVRVEALNGLAVGSHVRVSGESLIPN
ncbi:MAG: hypothetical protein NVS9B10_04150 [Nevskia sp.]